MIMTQRIPWLLPLLLSPLGLIIPTAPRSGPLFVLLLGVAGIAHCIRHRPSFGWLRTPPVYALGAFLSYLFLTSFWSTVPERSLEQAFRLTLLAFFALAGFSLVRSVDDELRKRIIQYLIPALIVGVITGCLYGLLQYTGPYIRILTNILGLSQEFSSFTTENRLHIAKTMLLTNFAFFALYPRLLKKRPTASVAAYGLFLLACWFSDSQSAFVTCLLGGFISVALTNFYKYAAKPIMIVILTSFIVIIPVMQSSYIEIAEEHIKETSLGMKSSLDTRIKIYKLFSSLSQERPLLGHGLMAGVKYKKEAPNTDFDGIYASIRTPHNLHLQIIFDLGAMGAILVLLGLLWPVWQLHSCGNYNLAGRILIVISLVVVSTSFNFVIWRAWIPSAAVLTLFFLLLSSENKIR